MDSHAITIPSYTAQESDLILNSLMSLRKEKIQQLLESHGLKGSGTKANQRETLLKALSDGKLREPQIVAYLDAIEPWGKQHVFLYD